MGHGAQVEFFLLKSVGDTVPLTFKRPTSCRQRIRSGSSLTISCVQAGLQAAGGLCQDRGAAHPPPRGTHQAGEGRLGHGHRSGNIRDAGVTDIAQVM